MAKIKMKNIILSCIFIASFDSVFAMAVEPEQQEATDINPRQKVYLELNQAVKDQDSDSFGYYFYKKRRSYFGQTITIDEIQFANDWLLAKLKEQDGNLPVLYLGARHFFNLSLSPQTSELTVSYFFLYGILTLIRTSMDIASYTRNQYEVNLVPYDHLKNKINSYWISQFTSSRFPIFKQFLTKIQTYFLHQRPNSNPMLFDFRSDLPSPAWATNIECTVLSTIEFKTGQKNIQAPFENHPSLIHGARVIAFGKIYAHLKEISEKDISNVEKWKEAFNLPIEIAMD